MRHTPISRRERAVGYAFSVKTLQSPKIKKLRRDLKEFREALWTAPLSMDRDRTRRELAMWGDNYRINIVPRLGKDNPNTSLYKKTGSLNTRYSHWGWRGGGANIRKKHAQHFDVYVYGLRSWNGYGTTNKDKSLFRQKLDQNQRLHCEDGPAFVLAGWEFYFWHGVQVSREILEKKLSIEKVLSLRNAELRRAAMQIIGWDKVIETLNPTLLDKSNDPKLGTLIQVNLTTTKGQQPNRVRFLKVQCGTGRDFYIPVSPNVFSVNHAQAWMWGVPVHKFTPPEVRT